MYAWAALKPADIVLAVQTFREMFSGTKANEAEEDAPPRGAPPADNAPARGSAAAE